MTPSMERELQMLGVIPKPQPKDHAEVVWPEKPKQPDPFRPYEGDF